MSLDTYAAAPHGRLADRHPLRPLPARSVGRGSGVPEPDDVQIGANLRAARKAQGMAQETLAEGIGLTFQQVQKYEKGQNRLSGSMMARACRVLQVPVATLFAGVEGLDHQEPEAMAAFRVAAKAAGGLELLTAYAAMTPDQRASVLGVARVVHGLGAGAPEPAIEVDARGGPRPLDAFTPDAERRFDRA